ncbi:MAG: ShlB/FhaC/HecB family hemolysin secretion/activation protein [Opitutaceae bacterium]
MTTIRDQTCLTWLGWLLALILPCAHAEENAARSAPPAVQSPVLRQILIADSVEAAQALNPVPGGGFVVVSPSLSFLNDAELTRRLAEGENRVIDDPLLIAIARVIEAAVRQQDFPIATAVIPVQSIAEGGLRVAVLLGKFREIKVQGNRWFSDSLLLDKLRVEQGEIVRLSNLDRAVSWTNNNPFRRVRVHIDPIPNTSEANLIVGVQERIPLRLLATYDNGGNDVIGNSRYTAAVSYANLWGLDHQGSYQYITSNKPRYFQGHGLDYRVPLRWRHYLQASASYLRAQPELYDGFFVQEGETITSDIRYSVPLRGGVNPVEAYAALSFKQSNNNLTWDPRGDRVHVLGTKTNIFQFTMGASMVRRDKRGAWAFSGNVTASPGGINSRNTDAAFDGLRHGGTDSARIGAKSSYVFGSFSVQRLLTLAPGWDLMSRGIAQASQANLLPSEQLTIGGASTVRGFNENIYAGDHGFVFVTDLLAPPLKKPLPYLSKRGGPLETRFLVFFDIGDTAVRHRFASDGRHSTLASTGVGMRMSLATNFSLTADYGWQLTELPYPVEEHSRGHIKVTFAY